MNTTMINPFQIQCVGELQTNIEGGTGDQEATAKATVHFTHDRSVVFETTRMFNSNTSKRDVGIEMEKRWKEDFESAVKRFLESTGGGCVKCK